MAEDQWDPAGWERKMIQDWERFDRNWRRFWWTLGIIVMLLVLEFLREYCYALYEYNHSTPQEIHAYLESIRYEPSTVTTHVNHPESFTTIWMTKEYGRLKSEEERIWQYAKPESILLVKQWNGGPYIDNIRA